MKHSDQLVFFIFSVSLLNSVQCQSGDDTLETSGDATIIENNDDDEGSGGSALETVTVEHTVSYSMSGSNGFEISLTFEDWSNSDQLHLLCSVKSSVGSGDCAPAVYLVAGHSSCSSLPGTVSAKLLAAVESEGEGDTVVDATYEELPGKCLIVVQKREGCSSDDESSGDTNTQETSGDSRIGEIDEDGFLRSQTNVLRSSGLGRSYNTISLSSFNLLSSGSTSAFTVVVSPSFSVQSVGDVVPGVVVTNYDKWSTLPYLQLTGWTYQDALNVVGVIVLILLLSQLPQLLSALSLAPLRRSFLEFVDYAQSDQFSSRIDNIQEGLLDFYDRTKDSIAHPWVNILQSLGQKYFDGINQRQYQDYYSTRRLDNAFYYDDSQDYYHEHYQPSQKHDQYKSQDENKESQFTYNFNDVFPEFDKFMSYLK